jgi:hypothetical protein
MNATTGDSSNSAQPRDAAPIKAEPAERLRGWLIIVTILAVIGILAAIPSTLFGTYMAAFAADDPSAPKDAVLNIMITVWVIAAGYLVLLVAGVLGGWIAYRKRRNRLSFGLSRLAVAPILVFVAAIAGVVLMQYLGLL